MEDGNFQRLWAKLQITNENIAKVLFPSALRLLIMHRIVSYATEIFVMVSSCLLLWCHFEITQSLKKKRIEYIKCRHMNSLKAKHYYSFSNWK